MKQAVNPEVEISPIVLAELSEKARIAGDPSKADYLLLLAWAAYDETEKTQTDIDPCSSGRVVAYSSGGHNSKMRF